MMIDLNLFGANFSDAIPSVNIEVTLLRSEFQLKTSLRRTLCFMSTGKFWIRRETFLLQK